MALVDFRLSVPCCPYCLVWCVYVCANRPGPNSDALDAPRLTVHTRTCLRPSPTVISLDACNLRLGREHRADQSALSGFPSCPPSTTMATADLSNNPIPTLTTNANANESQSVLPPPDKYRGAVVEVRTITDRNQIKSALKYLADFLFLFSSLIFFS